MSRFAKNKRLLPELQNYRLPVNLKKTLEAKKKQTGSTRWDYVHDCILRGTMTLLEARACVRLNRIPEFMQMRKSTYFYRNLTQ